MPPISIPCSPLPLKRAAAKHSIFHQENSAHSHGGEGRQRAQVSSSRELREESLPMANPSMASLPQIPLTVCAEGRPLQALEPKLGQNESRITENGPCPSPPCSLWELWEGSSSFPCSQALLPELLSHLQAQIFLLCPGQGCLQEVGGACPSPTSAPLSSQGFSPTLATLWAALASFPGPGKFPNLSPAGLHCHSLALEIYLGCCERLMCSKHLRHSSAGLVTSDF